MAQTRTFPLIPQLNSWPELTFSQSLHNHLSSCVISFPRLSIEVSRWNCNLLESKLSHPHSLCLWQSPVFVGYHARWVWSYTGRGERDMQPFPSRQNYSMLCIWVDMYYWKNNWGFTFDRKMIGIVGPTGDITVKQKPCLICISNKHPSHFIKVTKL